MVNQIDAAVLNYLRFHPLDGAYDQEILSASDSAWRRCLSRTDTAGMTFHLLARLRQRGHFQRLPISIQQRLEKNEKDQSARVDAMSQEFVEFNLGLQSKGIEYLPLKGLTYYPDFVDQPQLRVQYDHDFLIREPDLARAQEFFKELGYTSLESSRALPVDHLPTLVKRTGWSWTGNLYDPRIPRAVELHFRFWDPDFDLIPIRFPSDPWASAVQREFRGVPVRVLCREYALLYGVVHAFRHLLRNDLRLSHLYEIGYFLNHSVDDQAFWKPFTRRTESSGEIAKAASTIFDLSHRCFGNQCNPEIDRFLREHLPTAASVWNERFGNLEAMNCFRRSKSALLLHLALVPRAQRWELLRRRWLPRRLPLPSFGVQTPKHEQDLSFRLHRGLAYATQIFGRAVFQLGALARFMVAYPLWCWRLRRRIYARSAAAKPANGFSGRQ